MATLDSLARTREVILFDNAGGRGSTGGPDPSRLSRLAGVTQPVLVASGDKTDGRSTSFESLTPESLA